MLKASNIHYDVADRMRATNVGGIGVIHMLAHRTGLIDAIDDKLRLLKVHLPYHESDHVLNIAYNVLCGGTCLDDLELRRQDEVYLDALDARTIPDPTTAGDFCRRFETVAHVEQLMEAINEARLKVWRRQPDAFFDQARIDGDGSMVPTTGECKEGTDFSYKGDFGYHPLLISLANTGEPLFLDNRPGNRPSQEGAAARFDHAIALCRRGGFRRILLRGDTDFSQTAYLDGWDKDNVEFIFGIDAMPNLVTLAEQLSRSAWRKLDRPKPQIKTKPRERPRNVREQVVIEREYKNLRLQGEDVATFDYRPGNCKRSYRVVVVRKDLSIESGQQRLFEEYRYFFYITNVRDEPLEQIVLQANQRCNQENLIDQLKNHVRALRAPVDNLMSNWAYMVMASLGWSLKAWLALWIQPTGRGRQDQQSRKGQLLGMEFKRFCDAMIRVPCQIIRGARRVTYRLLSWNDWQTTLLRLADALRPRRASP